MLVDAYGASDTGLVRQRNEDQYLIARMGKSMLIQQTSLSLEDQTRLTADIQGYVLLVADGLGGHAAGDVASAAASHAVVEKLLHTISWRLPVNPGEDQDLREDLRQALEASQLAIERLAHERPMFEDMGTTLSLAYVLWPRLYVVHVGDTRVYLLRGARLERITRDHTLAQRMEESGAGTQGRMEESRFASVLWNALGGGSSRLRPDVFEARMEVGDTLLLCSDGLTHHLSDDEIQQVLEAADGSAQQACLALVEGAKQAGGEDNVTALVARFSSTEA
jgi:protein phosphatase